QLAVAEWIGSTEDDHVEIAILRMVLQPIVEEQHVRARLDRALRDRRSPRLSTAGRLPRAINRWARKSVTGVFPAPPTVRLPIEITGACARTGVARLR